MAKANKKTNRQKKGLGSVYYEAYSGKWVAMADVGTNATTGKRLRSKSRHSSQADAVTALKNITSAVDQGSLNPDSKLGRLTVSMWLDQWMERFIKPHKAPKTVNQYNWLCDIHLKPAFGKLDVKRITSAQISKAFAQKAEFGVSTATISAARRTFRTAMNEAIRQGYRPTNPVALTPAPVVKRKEARFLTPTQAEVLLEQLAHDDIKPLVRFALRTGCRISEIIGLTWDCVSTEKAEIRISKQLQRVGGEWTFRDLKTRNSGRTLPIGDELRAVLADQKSRQMVDAKPNPHNLVFTNSNGNPFDLKMVDTHFKAALKKAALPPGGFHSLRHTAVSIMLDNGVDIAIISRFVGHSTIAVTVNTYAHVMPGRFQDAAAKLDAALKPEPK
jgi:integrase